MIRNVGISSIQRLVPIIFLTGCAAMEMMKYSENDFNSRTRAFKEDHLRKYAPVDAKDFNFENSEVKIAFTPTIEDAVLSVKIENKSNKNIKILWDESTFIDGNKNADGVFHAGVVINEREKPQMPTLIPSGSQITDDIVPKKKPFLYGGQTWLYEPICGIVDLATPSHLNATHRLNDSNCVGKTFTFNLVYELDGKQKTAKLSFKYASKSAPPPETKVSGN